MSWLDPGAGLGCFYHLLMGQCSWVPEPSLAVPGMWDAGNVGARGPVAIQRVCEHSHVSSQVFGKREAADRCLLVAARK